MSGSDGRRLALPVRLLSSAVVAVAVLLIAVALVADGAVPTDEMPKAEAPPVDELVVKSIRSKIHELIIQDQSLVEPVGINAKIVRLAFHDCVGGCDGCVDMADPDNFGLDIPIKALAPIVEMYPYSETGLSRADIWAMAGLQAAYDSQLIEPGARGFFDYVLEYSGRPDCAGDYLSGPHREMPQATGNGEYVVTYFRETFGLENITEVVALMGAHSLGQANLENSGYNGTWMGHPKYLDNTYFDEMMAGPWTQTTLKTGRVQWTKSLEYSITENTVQEIPEDDIGSLETLAALAAEEEAAAPTRHRKLLDEGEDILTDAAGGVADDGGVPEGYLMMLNVDMGLSLELDEDLYDNTTGISPFYTGLMRCDFDTCERSGLRPVVHQYQGLIKKEVFFHDFEAVYKKILNFLPAEEPNAELIPIKYTVDPTATPVPYPDKPICVELQLCD